MKTKQKVRFYIGTQTEGTIHHGYIYKYSMDEDEALVITTIDNKEKHIWVEVKNLIYI